MGFLKWGLKKTCYFLYGISSICPHNLMLISLEPNNFFLIRETSLLPQIRFSEWTLPMKYANYIHACVQTLLVADAQSRLRHAPISRVQNSAMFPHFANQNVSAHALRAIYIFHGKGLLHFNCNSPKCAVLVFQACI